MSIELITTPVQRIVLTGFMGAGKSTVGALLARKLGWNFVDVDEFLVQTHGASIAGIFAAHGELGFRELETEAVRNCLERDLTVIALGGGALESVQSREFLAGSAGTYTIFLDTPLEMAIARCAGQSQGAVRPVLADRARLEERFTRRLEHYRQAHQTLSTVNRTPEEIVQLVAESLSSVLPIKTGRRV